MDNASIHRQLPRAIKDFLVAMARDPELACLQDIWSRTFQEMDVAADGDTDMCSIMTAAEVVCSRRRPVRERLSALIDLGRLKAKDRTG